MKDLINLTDDLNQVKQSISQLQASISKILQTTPNEEDIETLMTAISNSNEPLIDKLKFLISSPHIKLAVKFKQLMEKEQLPFLKMFTAVNLKLLKPDESIDYLLNFEPKNETIDQIIDDENTGLPQLLKIKDDVLIQKIFIDKSFIDPVIYMENVEGVNEINNSKLILKGKYLLNVILVDIINEVYPNLYYQDVEVLIQKMVNIQLLFKLSLIYNLTNNLKYNVSKQSSDEAKIKLIGDLFYSYLGGLSLEYSSVTLKLWIKKIYYRVFKDFFPPNNIENLVDDSLDNLIGKIYQNEFNFIFKDLKFEIVDTDPYVVKLGDIIGTNSSEEGAKINCIKEFLNNKTLKLEYLNSSMTKAIELKDIYRKSEKFREKSQNKDYNINYSLNEFNNLYQVTIRADQLNLAVCIDSDKALATSRCEAIAYENLLAIWGQDE
ncbi:hypothetical protein CLIB1444_05S07668 [[Candida] jaroonii]|uniref:Uncharacterized protein n=1 Tax=[Candida] jaroonii TaxID=467808 RepID=A0ACA9Y957_9ASCO|nr:hypothetical protein CLIB1444_05S07668 [[Candida] jaroonii]